MGHECYMQLILTVSECGGQDDVIRLFSGASTMEGVVEYCLNSTWTPVCGDNWDDTEAAVACRQLGLAGGVHIVNINWLFNHTQWLLWLQTSVETVA